MLLRLDVLGQLLEVHEQVVRRPPAAVALVAGGPLGEGLDAGVLDPAHGRRRTTAGDQHGLGRLHDADVGRPHRPHGADELRDLLVEEHREPGRATLDELLGDQVGLAQAELRAAAVGVVDLHDHHRVLGGRALGGQTGQRPLPGDREALGRLLRLRLLVGLVVGLAAEPASASAATRPSATTARARAVRCARIATDCIDAGGIANHAVQCGAGGGRQRRPPPAGRVVSRVGGVRHGQPSPRSVPANQSPSQMRSLPTRSPELGEWMIIRWPSSHPAKTPTW